MPALSLRGLAPVYASLAILAPALLFFQPAAQAEQAEPWSDNSPTAPTLTDVIIVTAKHPAASDPEAITPSVAPVLGPDASALIARLPGAAQINNGSLSGQIQYRGLFGPRVAVRINGQAFASGGPNLMDPPLHYAPLPLIERIRVARGVGGVSEGPGLGGLVDVDLKKVDFATSPQTRATYDLMAEGRSVDESYAIGGVAGVANDRLRFHVLGSREKGENRDIPGGSVANTFFERDMYGIGAGARFDAHTFSIDLRRNNTGPTGNPPFAMDIQFMDTDFVRLGYTGQFDGLRVDASFGFTDVDHGMDNFTLRPNSAAPMGARHNRARAETITGMVKFTIPVAGGDLKTGVDIQRAEHTAQISNPNMAGFFLDSIADVDVNRTGGFLEWHGDLGRVEAGIGARYDHYQSNAGEATVGDAVPMGPRLLAQAFNIADKRHGDDALDLVARLWWPADEQTTWRVTFARKTRAPGFVERFSWLPTEASAGLADGNIYVGDPGLKPEVAWIAEAGFDWNNGRFFARPTVFYRRIDDFIQGVPIDDTAGIIDTPIEMVAAMNGDDTPLRFANVNAELYGIDMDFGMQIDRHFRLDGVASWVRGKRRDVTDNLYRIAPARATLALSYERNDWSILGEGRFVARQSKVSLTNSEQATSGYALFGLRVNWQAQTGVGLTLGVENLFDKRHEDHLGGYNRVIGSDVPLGARLPGVGRGAFLRVSVRG